MKKGVQKKRTRSQAKTFVILGQEYTRREIDEKVELIKYYHGLEASVKQADAEFLHGLLKLHPAYEEKTNGEKILRFMHVKCNGNTSGFVFVTESGRRDDFAPKKCLQTREQYLRGKVLGAYRTAITDQIREYKADRGFGEQNCDKCGTAIANYDWGVFDPVHAASGHVDHVKDANKFAEILNAFKLLNPAAVTPELKQIPPQFRNGQEGTWVLADDDLAERWNAYHKEHATLRLLCATCNGKEK